MCHYKEFFLPTIVGSILEFVSFSGQHLNCHYRDCASCYYRKYLRIHATVGAAYECAIMGIVNVYAIVGSISISVPLFGQYVNNSM